MFDWYFILTKKSLAGFNAISYDNIIVTYFWATLYIIPKNTYAYRNSTSLTPLQNRQNWHFRV